MNNIDKNIIDNEFYNKLNDNQKKNYIYVYNIYYSYFLEYLEKILNIKMYDDILKKSNNNYKKIGKDEMDFYQKLSSDVYDYFYLRNFLHIERLSKDELNTLYSFYSDGKKIDEQIIIFIKNTIKRVLIEKPNVKENTRINYGPFSPEYFAPNLSLILAFRYDDYFENYDGEFERLNGKRELEIETLIDLMNKKLSVIVMKSLGIEFNIIKYNEYSIKDSTTLENINIM